MIVSRKGYVLIKIERREERKKLISEGVICVVHCVPALTVHCRTL